MALAHVFPGNSIQDAELLNKLAWRETQLVQHLLSPPVLPALPLILLPRDPALEEQPAGPGEGTTYFIAAGKDSTGAWALDERALATG